MTDQFEKGQFMLKKASEQMIKEITNLFNETKSKLRSEINNSIIYVYWNIGRIIVPRKVID